MQRRNVFAGPYVDRAAHLRRDSAWFASALADANSRVVPVWNSRSLIAYGDEPRAAFLAFDEIPPERRSVDTLVLLGRVNGRLLELHVEHRIRQSPDDLAFEDGTALINGELCNPPTCFG